MYQLNKYAQYEVLDIGVPGRPTGAIGNLSWTVPGCGEQLRGCYHG